MKVVIVGGGLGGVRAALKLANRKGIDVKLISPQSYFEYHAALYRSATGRSPLEVAIPLKDFFGYAKNVEVIDDTIEDIDSKDQVVVGKSDSRYEYEKLIRCYLYGSGWLPQYFSCLEQPSLSRCFR
jgi:NADH dehydrogenase FAD-containing subunit